MERVIVFIDGSNFYFGCKQNKVNAPWEMVALARELAGRDRRLVRVYYYNARSREKDVPQKKYQKEEKFYGIMYLAKWRLWLGEKTQRNRRLK